MTKMKNSYCVVQNGSLTLLVLALTPYVCEKCAPDSAKIVSLKKNCSTHHKYEEGLLDFFLYHK